MPKCPKCNAEKFIMNELEISNSNEKMVAICCESCGAIISVLPADNCGGAFQDLKESIEKIAKVVNETNKRTVAMNTKMNSLRL